MGIFTGSTDLRLVKQTYSNFVSIGSKISAADFMARIDGYSNMQYLVKTFQLPPMQREMMELTGPLGVMVQQQGKPINAFEASITFQETVDGHVMAMLHDWVANRRYRNIEVQYICEENANPNRWQKIKLFDCWLSMDAQDLSTEDSAAPLQITCPLHVNWCSWFDVNGADITASININF